MDAKTCTKCGETKTLNEFHCNRSMADGRLNQCKECRKQWVLSNKEKIKERQRRRYNENAERERARLREWRNENPEKYCAQRESQKIRDAERIKIDPEFVLARRARSKRRYESAKMRTKEGMIVTPDNPKCCSKCGIKKQAQEFQIQPTGSRSSRCKSCIAEYMKKYRERSIDKIRRRKKFMYWSGGKEKQREYRRAHTEKHRAQSRRAYTKNPQKFKAAAAEYAKAHPELKKKWAKRYYKKSVRLMTDAYVSSLITSKTGLTASDVKHLIKLKRTQLQIYRATKQLLQTIEEKKHGN